MSARLAAAAALLAALPGIPAPFPRRPPNGSPSSTTVLDRSRSARSRASGTAGW